MAHLYVKIIPFLFDYLAYSAIKEFDMFSLLYPFPLSYSSAQI